MPGAFYHKGLTVEFDSSIPRLTIEGNEVPTEKVEGLFGSSEPPAVKREVLFQRAQEIIEHSPEFKKREAIKQDHLAILKKGVKHWNEWRRENPEIRPLLYDTDLSGITFGVDFSSANFSNANLINSNLSQAKLVVLGQISRRICAMINANHWLEERFEMVFGKNLCLIIWRVIIAHLFVCNSHKYNG